MGPGSTFPDLLTFRIDTLGVNTPLVSESFTANGIWEAGEIWEFVIQDYGHPVLPPSAIDSIGLGSLDPPSSGSIIAVPEPSPLLLGFAGLLSLAVLRRR